MSQSSYPRGLSLVLALPWGYLRTLTWMLRKSECARQSFYADDV